MPEKQEHVSFWHPYTDRPGQRHTPTLWNEELAGMSVKQLIQFIGGNQLYCFCNDILSEQPEELLRAVPMRDKYMSRTQKVVALRLASGGKSGFMVSGSTWGCKTELNPNLPSVVNNTFQRFGYEAITPASLSEKVLRSTLPAKCKISRPSDMIRRTLLENKTGGRIDSVSDLKYYHNLYSYDETKSYLDKAYRGVPSPFLSPVRLYYGDNGYQDFRWLDYAHSWVDCFLVAHGTGTHPIQVREENGVMREPREGEKVHRWLWEKEVLDCLEHGYTLEHVESAYCWEQSSTFMREWADILWEKYLTCENPWEQDVIKTMMVGLPGRFLKSPEQYLLVHLDDYKGKDLPTNAIPIVANWLDDDRPVVSNWLMIPEYNLQSNQLTQVGSYIVMAARQKLWRFIREEEKRGNTFVRSYIDCASFTQPLMQTERLGKERGMYKETIDSSVYVTGNAIIPREYARMKAPSYELDGKERLALWSLYHNVS